jgi:LacI family transcriptional regulator
MDNKKANIDIKEVARLAGVSKTTVSHTLSGNRYVKEETKRKIFDIVKEYNYEPNIVARSLNKKESNLVGVITTELNNDFNSEIIEGVEEVLNSKGYILVINASNYNLEKEESIIKKLNSLYVDGLILVGGPPSLKHISSSNFRTIPIVSINRADKKNVFSNISIDYKAAMIKAVDYLCQLGHKNIGYVGWQKKDEIIPSVKFEGYLEGLKRNNLKRNNEIIFLYKDYMKDSFNEVNESIRAYLESGDHNKNPGFSSLVCQTDQIALGALSALKVFYEIPKEISVVGFGNTDFSRFSEPALTTISIPRRGMGISGAKVFLNEFKNLDKEKEAIVLDTELIIRNSTGNLNKS